MLKKVTAIVMAPQSTALIAPLKGGAFLMNGYRKELYLPLSKDEENLLFRLMPTVCANEQHLLATIINKYALPKQST